MFEIIKEQWNEGCYSSASDLDIYVQAGWITKEQEDEITAPKDPVVEQPTSTAPSSAATSQASAANSVAHI